MPLNNQWVKEEIRREIKDLEVNENGNTTNQNSQDATKVGITLAGVAQWIERQPVNQRVAGLIPSQGTCLGCGPGPQ